MGQHLRCAIYNKCSRPDIFATKRPDTWGRSRSILRMRIRHIFSERHILGRRSPQAHFWPSLIKDWKKYLNKHFQKEWNFHSWYFFSPIKMTVARKGVSRNIQFLKIEISLIAVHRNFFRKNLDRIICQIKFLLKISKLIKNFYYKFRNFFKKFF